MTLAPADAPSGEPKERVVILGAGMAGLTAALALEGSREVWVFERDPEPPEIDPADALDAWKRPGVPQFRQSHVLLGRLHALLRDRHPELLQELLDAGLWQLPVSEFGRFREGYSEQPGDRDLVQLCGRRSTFEYVLRRHVARLAHVRLRHGVRVAGLVLDRSGGIPHVEGVEIVRHGAKETVTADVVVDAMGRRSRVPGWLRSHGIACEVREESSQFIYFSRHYVLQDGAEPPRDEQSGDLDYLKYLIAYAERGRFSIALGCHDQDEELAKLLRDPDNFDAVCRRIPLLNAWVSRARPVSPVYGAGNIMTRWIRAASRDQPTVLGLFMIGDATMVSNPIYGRGCASAFVQAHVLADALNLGDDPLGRRRLFERWMRRELEPYYELSISGDRLFQVRIAQARGERVPLAQRLLSSAYIKLLIPGIFGSPSIARDVLGLVHMRQPGSPWGWLGFARRVLTFWLLRALGAGPTLPDPDAPPSRADMLRELNPRLAATRDPVENHT